MLPTTANASGDHRPRPGSSPARSSAAGRFCTTFSPRRATEGGPGGAAERRRKAPQQPEIGTCDRRAPDADLASLQRCLILPPLRKALPCAPLTASWLASNFARHTRAEPAAGFLGFCPTCFLGFSSPLSASFSPRARAAGRNIERPGAQHLLQHCVRQIRPPWRVSLLPEPTAGSPLLPTSVSSTLLLDSKCMPAAFVLCSAGQGQGIERKGRAG